MKKCPNCGSKITYSHHYIKIYECGSIYDFYGKNYGETTKCAFAKLRKSCRNLMVLFFDKIARLFSPEVEE